MDELEPLRRFPAFPRPDAERVSRIRDALSAAIDEERAASLRSRSLSGPRRLRWALAGAIAAALGLTGALVALLPFDGGRVESAAAQVLRHEAAVAAEQPAGPTPKPGQYVYTKSEGANLVIAEDWSALQSSIREIWIGPDGSGRIVETLGEPRFLSVEDRAAWRAAGSPDLGAGQTTDERFPCEGSREQRPTEPVAPGSPEACLSYLDLSGLPTDPDALRAKIEDRSIVGGPPGDAETFTIIGDLLRETYASPALRSALYRVASELPGVELVGEVKDPSGRDGVAVAYTDSYSRRELIFDSETSALLGEREVLVDPKAAELNADPGAVIGYTSYLASGVVESLSSKP
jgi:hypothetical protein